MAAIKPFTPTNHKPADRSPVPNSPPEGWPAIIVDGQQKNSQSTPGATYIALVFEINEGPHKGRKVFHNLNLGHTKPEVVKMAEDDLYFICLACGVTTEIGDTEQLKKLPLRIVTKLAPQKRNGVETGDFQTVIKEFRRRDGSSVMPKRESQTAPPANSHGHDDSAPFKR